MADKVNLIKNGDFEAKGDHWSGNDIEANHKEKAYLKNGEDNRVAEMDGHRGKETVMEQSFDVTDPISTELTFDSALRNAAMNDAGSDGFTVEILNADGEVIADMLHLPEHNEMQEFSMPVSFPDAGTYTLRFTEFGDDDSLGAIIDKISIFVCFARGTRIRGKNGELTVEEISAGDWVQTLDHGLQQVRWIGSAKRAGIGAAAPILIQKNTLGNSRDLLVSQQHRMLLRGWRAKLFFGKAEVLASAVSLVDGKNIRKISMPEVEYFHILFDRHEIIFAEGCPTESFYPNAESVSALDAAAQAEIFDLFPELQFGPVVRPEIKAHEASLMA